MSQDEKSEFNAWKAVTIFLLQTVDSALLPWVCAELFVLGLVYIVTRNLDSKDTYALLRTFFSFRGVAWAGWVIALIEVPIFRGIYRQGGSNKDERIKRLEDENTKARKLLSKEKQAELGLNEKQP